MDLEEPRKVGVATIKEENGEESVLLYLNDMHQAVGLDPEAARNLAFALMEAADYLDAPKL